MGVKHIDFVQDVLARFIQCLLKNNKGDFMIVYHVTSKKKFLKYLSNGCILGPVRAWKNIEAAQRFSKQTGRRIILRLKFPEDALPYPGHRHEAVFIAENYKIDF